MTAFSEDFLQTIVNVNFGGAWAVINTQVGGVGGTDWRAEIDFTAMAGGTPGIFCFTQSNSNSKFKKATEQDGLPFYTVAKSDPTSKLRTDAGKTITAFGVVDPNIPFFAVLFVQLNAALAQMRLKFTDSGAVGAFVNVSTYKDLKVGTRFTPIDPGTQGFSIGSQTGLVARESLVKSEISGGVNIIIDPKKLTIALS